jgi:hypothetical protein
MSPNTNFQALRKKTYLSYHQDGLIDLVIGLSTLGFGISIAAEGSGFIVLSWIGFLLYAPLKKVITVPRLGFVKFDNEQTMKTKTAVLLAIGISTFALFLGVYIFRSSGGLSTSFQEWLSKYNMLVLGTFLAISLLGGALITGVKRLLVYAALTELIILGGIVLGIAEPIFVMVLGGLLTVSGFIFLVRFLQKYPKINGDDYGHE